MEPINMKKNIHVTIIGGGQFSTLGGIVRSIVEIANYLVVNGHSVKILANGRNGDKPFYQVHPDVEVEFVNYPYNVRRIEWFRRVLKKQKTDLFLLLFSNKVGFNVALAAYGLSVPVLRSEHGNPSHLVEHIWNGNHRIRDMTFQMSDYSHVLLNEFSQDPILPESVRSHIFHIPSPINLDVKVASPGDCFEGKKRIIYCGRIESFEKDTQSLFDAFLELESEFQDWSLEFFGDGGLRAELEALIPPDLKERVLFHGAVLPERLSRELSSSHIFVIPSKTEGCPMSLGEAMAHGLPAIGFRECRGVSDLIRHNETGILCDVGVSFRGEGLIEPLRTMMSSREMRMKFGRTAVQHAREFDSELVLKQWQSACLKTASLRNSLKEFRDRKVANFVDMKNLKEDVTSVVDYVKVNGAFPASKLKVNNKTDFDAVSIREFECSKLLPILQVVEPEERPFISVVIPVFNMEKFVEEAIGSVISQSIQNIEIIAVNDGSTDESLVIMLGLERQDGRLMVVDQQNMGVSSARNVGLSKARGKYVFFWDGDDVLLPGCLERLFIEAEVNDSDIVTGGLYHFQDGVGRQPQWVIPRYALLMGRNNVQADIFSDSRLRYDVSACNKLFNREFLNSNNIRFPEGMRLEDVFFAWSAYLVAKKVCVSNVEVGGYRKIAGSSKGSSLWGAQKVDSVLGVYRSLVAKIDKLTSEEGAELKIDLDIYFSYLLFYAINTVVGMDARTTEVQKRRYLVQSVLSSIDRRVLGLLPYEFQRVFSAFLGDCRVSKVSLSKYVLKEPFSSADIELKLSKIGKIKVFDALESVSKRLPRSDFDLVDYYLRQSLGLIKYSVDSMCKGW